MHGLGRLLAWPFKAAAWALILVAYLLAARYPDDTIKSWMDREFLS